VVVVVATGQPLELLGEEAEAVVVVRGFLVVFVLFGPETPVNFHQLA
jgi:hypothetical protein